MNERELVPRPFCHGNDKKLFTPINYYVWTADEFREHLRKTGERVTTVFGVVRKNRNLAFSLTVNS